MPFVRNLGAANPFTGWASMLGGYMNALKANASQSRFAQFQADLARDSAIGNALGNFVTPMAVAGGARLGGMSPVDARNMALFSAGFGVPGGAGMSGMGGGGSYGNRQFMQEYGIDRDTAYAYGATQLAEPEIARIVLGKYGVSPDQFKQLPDADRDNLQALIGANSFKQNAQGAAVDKATAKQYEEYVAGNLSIPPEAEAKIRALHDQEAQVSNQYAGRPELQSMLPEYFASARMRAFRSVPANERKPKQVTPVLGKDFGETVLPSGGVARWSKSKNGLEYDFHDPKEKEEREDLTPSMLGRRIQYVPGVGYVTNGQNFKVLSDDADTDKLVSQAYISAYTSYAGGEVPGDAEAKATEAANSLARFLAQQKRQRDAAHGQGGGPGPLSVMPSAAAATVGMGLPMPTPMMGLGGGGSPAPAPVATPSDMSIDNGDIVDWVPGMKMDTNTRYRVKGKPGLYRWSGDPKRGFIPLASNGA